MHKKLDGGIGKRRCDGLARAFEVENMVRWSRISFPELVPLLRTSRPTQPISSALPFISIVSLHFDLASPALLLFPYAAPRPLFCISIINRFPFRPLFDLKPLTSNAVPVVLPLTWTPLYQFEQRMGNEEVVASEITSSQGVASSFLSAGTESHQTVW